MNEDIQFHGIDVSKWQGDIDWEAVKSDGVDFAILRLGSGSKNGNGCKLDVKFEQYVAGAKAAGVDIGCYFYSYAATVDEALAEAQFVVDTLQNYPGVFTYPIALDQEYPPLKDVGKEILTDVVLAFDEVITNYGYYFSLYSSPGWLKFCLDDSKLSNIDHWLAQWAETPTYEGSYGIWQNSCKGHVNGISVVVDTDIAYLNYPEIIMSGGLNGFSALPSDNISRSGLITYIRSLYCANCPYGGHTASTSKSNCSRCRVTEFINTINSFDN